MTHVDYLAEAIERLSKIRRYLRANAGPGLCGGLRGGLGYHLDQLEQDLGQVCAERRQLRRELAQALAERDRARAERDELHRRRAS